jgi:hypothetical protein
MIDIFINKVYMKYFLNEEIKRSLVLMGLPERISHRLSEAISAAASTNPILEFMAILKTAMKKGDVEVLTAEERRAIAAFADELQGQKVIDDFGDVGERLTKDQLTILKNYFSGTRIYKGIDIAYASMIYHNTTATIRYLEVEEEIFESLERQLAEVSDNSTEELKTVRDLFDAAKDNELSPAVRAELAEKAKVVAAKLEEDNIYKKLILDTADNEAAKAERQAKNGNVYLVTDDEIGKVTDEGIQQLKDAADTGLSKMEDEFEDIVFRGIEDLEEEIGEEEAVSLEEAAQKAFMERMNQTCKSKFCGTMYAYWKGKSPKFDSMWDIMVKELEKMMKTSTGQSLSRIPKETEDTYNIILKKFKEGNTPLTLDQYMTLGQKVYDKWSKGGIWERFSLSGLFGTGRQSMVTLGRFSLGSDLYTGKWTLKSSIKRWAPFNALWLLWSIGVGVYELKVGSDDPNKTTEDILKEAVVDWVKNSVATGFGLALAPRLAMEGLIEGFQFLLPPSTYVNKEDLIEYLKKNSLSSQGTAWTILEINDNIFNKKGVKVYFGPDDEPPITQITGIKDPAYSIANGRYYFEKTGDFSYKLVFIPEGQKKPKVEEEKTDELDKKSIQNIEDQIATNSIMTPFIKDRLTGIIKNHKKHLDFKSQKKMSTDDGGIAIVLIFEYKDNVTDKSEMFAFNYTKYKTLVNPDLKSATTWDTIVKSYKE